MRTRTLIGHRGAAAYAPETRCRLSIWPSGADALEHDLHATRDGVLVCLHDRTLERTTNVREVFPDRARDGAVDGRPGRHWCVHDFTMAEIGRLDAGAWFDARFTGARVPTLQDLIDHTGTRAALLPS